MAGLSIDRLQEYVEVQGSCWTWIRSRSDRGYGVHSRNHRLRYAHRTVYQLLIGPVPKGLELDHLCLNKACVNPDHLEPVTHRVNVLRAPTAKAAIYARRTACNRGHPFDDVNTLFSQGYRRCRECHRLDWKRVA